MPPAPITVFVSHSKYDTEVKKYFSQIFAHKGIHAIFMEWENLGKAYAGKVISDTIMSKDTKAVIVLLGKALETPPVTTPEFTHNWVNFEVGVACAAKKPVWVFEDFNEIIKFPIPYVTDYCRYNMNNDEHIKQIGSLLERDSNSTTKGILCAYENCNAVYRYWSTEVEFICPVCRRSLKLNPPKNEGSENQQIT
ncbi:MAG: hypothetical protein KGH60_05135 [Candidatus Micrarchaeota archaeon]|nr:hypothetical protein [Candidatus Micrarchaeota archaeon]